MRANRRSVLSAIFAAAVSPAAQAAQHKGGKMTQHSERHQLLERRISAYGVELGQSKPNGPYAPLVEDQGTIQISGMTPAIDGRVVYTGRAGAETSIDDARRAARIAALRCLKALHDHLGDLGRIRRVTKMTVYLQAAPGFTTIGDVSNAASDLLNDVLAPHGEHARTTVAVVMAPRNAVLEIDMTVTVDPA